MRHKEDGFTLIELLVVMGLSTILLGLGAFAARQFWFARSLIGGQDQIATQMRTIQQLAVSDGVSTRYYGAYFTAGSAEWGTVRYNGSPSAACTVTNRLTLDAGVVVERAGFDDTGATTATTTCRALTAVGGDAEIAWFFSRGTATPGDLDPATGLGVEIDQPRLERPLEEIHVLGLTGRVEKG